MALCGDYLMGRIKGDLLMSDCDKLCNQGRSQRVNASTGSNATQRVPLARCRAFSGLAKLDLHTHGISKTRRKTGVKEGTSRIAWSMSKQLSKHVYMLCFRNYTHTRRAN